MKLREHNFIYVRQCRTFFVSTISSTPSLLCHLDELGDKRKALPDFITYDEWPAVSVNDDIFLGTEPEMAGTVRAEGEGSAWPDRGGSGRSEKLGVNRHTAP